MVIGTPLYAGCPYANNNNNSNCADVSSNDNSNYSDNTSGLLGLGNRLKSNEISNCAPTANKEVLNSIPKIDMNRIKSIIQQILDFIKEKFGDLIKKITIKIKIPTDNTNSSDNDDNYSGNNDSNDYGNSSGNSDYSDNENTNDDYTTNDDSSSTPPTMDSMPESSSELAKAIKEKFGVSITGSPSKRKLEALYKTLSQLPESFRSRTDKISYHNIDSNVAGYVWIPKKTVHLNASASLYGTLIHEMTHTWQGGNRALSDKWSSQFWGRRSAFNQKGGKGSGSVTSYGNTNPLEDMAESVRFYATNPINMKRTHPNRYAFITNNIMNGAEYTGSEFPRESH